MESGKVRYLYLFIPFMLVSEESFMTNYEYGEMLYFNPRGISCAACHGDLGEGKLIGKYIDEEKGKQIIKGSDIRTKSLQEMLIAMNTKHSIMPRYYLTNSEVERIYEYLKTKNENVKK